MSLTNKQYLKIILSHAKDNIRFGKIQNVKAEDLIVEGLSLLLDKNHKITLERRNNAANNFIKAYEHGSALGTFLAGLVYKYGFGINETRRDTQLGDSLIIVASKGRQDAVAQYFVGIDLITKSNPSCIEYLEASAAKGLKEPLLPLAMLYLFRSDIVETNYEKAQAHLQKLDTFGQKLWSQVQNHRTMRQKGRRAAAVVA